MASRNATKKGPKQVQQEKHPEEAYAKLELSKKLVCYNCWHNLNTAGEEGWDFEKAGSIYHYRNSNYIKDHIKQNSFPKVGKVRRSNFLPLVDRTVSFNDRHESQYKRNSFYRRLLKVSQKPEWAVISPMTRHVFPSERSGEHKEEGEDFVPWSPVRLPRRRSRSFNDFIDKKDKDYDAYGIRPVSDSKKPKPKWNVESSNGGKKLESCNDSDKDVYSEVDVMPFYMSVLYGAINCTIVLPVIMSFGNIIYRDNAFVDYMPVLIKLTLFSGMVHQLCFSFFSTLKFAVGSVQDAGLIFFSKMAHDMVYYCRANNYDDEVMLATVTIGLGLAAALLGVGLIIIGKLGLASYVQMLPTCVVAGYLACIGWFVGYSGLGIMAGESSLTPMVLFENLPFVLPGVLGGAFIYVSVRKLRHVAVLPLCITFLLVLFYAILMVTGSTIEDATNNGWIRKSETVPAWNETWDYLQIDKVAWGAYPQLWRKTDVETSSSGRCWGRKLALLEWR
jgi:hypothetical protein